MHEAQRWNAVAPPRREGPEKRPGTHTTWPRRGEPNGPRKTPKVREKPTRSKDQVRRGRRRKHHGQRVSKSDQAKTRTRQRKPRDRRAERTQARTKGWCPEAERHPRTAGPRGENRRVSSRQRAAGPPSRRGVARPKQKNKKFVLSRVVSSVGSFRGYTKQERRFHGCLPTVVSSSSEHKPKMR